MKLHLSNETISLLLSKLPAVLQNAPRPFNQALCASPDYKELIVLDAPESFLPVDTYLPVMELNDDWYCSETCILLTRNADGIHEIQYGVLAKWLDEDHLFWYEYDAIYNVVGWMPYYITANETTLSKLHKLLKQTQGVHDSMWTANLSAVDTIKDNRHWIDVNDYIPVLHHETEKTICSDQMMVKFGRNTVNGVLTGYSNAKLVYDHESCGLYWDMSAFDYRYHSTCKVLEWRPMPSTLQAEFNPSLKDVSDASA